MLPISAEATLAKNAITDSGVFLFLIEVITNDGTHLYFAKNTEQVTWRSLTWEPLAIVDTSIEYDSKGKLPEITLTLSNISRVIQNYVELDVGNYGSGWTVLMYMVHTDNLDSDTPELELQLTVKKIEANELTITFTLGTENPLKLPVPRRRTVPNTCQAIFKDVASGCTYSGDDTSCGKTLSDCEAKFGTSVPLPFIGFPSMPSAILRMMQ